MKLRFIRDEVSKGKVMIEKVSIEENVAYMPTTNILSSKFKYCLELVKLVQY